MALMEAAHLLKVGAELGEGPVWIENALWFVDIKRNLIFRFNPATGYLAHWLTPEHPGWVLPGAAGTLIVGLKSGPHHFAPEAGTFKRIGHVDIDLPDNRLNDAAIDPQGRIWFGTMDNLESSATGRVYVLDHGIIEPSDIAPVTITNGPAISPCGNLLYHVDTLGRKVLRHEISADGTVSAPHVFLHFTGEEGHPDGACCDLEGGIWLGFYGGCAARRYAPDGSLTNEVQFPVSNVTKIAIGGPDGRTAYATTAKQGLSQEQLADQPLAGDLFTFPVNVPAAPLKPANS